MFLAIPCDMGYCLKLGHSHIPPDRLQFIIHYHRTSDLSGNAGDGRFESRPGERRL